MEIPFGRYVSAIPAISKLTTSAKSENCERGKHERASTGESMDARRCSTMGTPVPRRRGFWRSAESLRVAGYDSVLSLTQDIVNDNLLAPRLNREPEGRGTQHIRLLIPRGVKGLSENDRVTLQAWLELVDWIGRNVLPHT